MVNTSRVFFSGAAIMAVAAADQLFNNPYEYVQYVDEENSPATSLYLVPTADPFHHGTYHGLEHDHDSHAHVAGHPIVTHHEGVHHEVVPTTVHHTIPAGA